LVRATSLIGQWVISELDEFLGEVEEDVEGMQSMIYVLTQQLKDSKEQITLLQEENTKLQQSPAKHQQSPSKHSPHKNITVY
jgi:cell division septum initiation protein DivIVA